MTSSFLPPSQYLWYHSPLKISERPPWATAKVEIVLTSLVKSTTPAMGELNESGVSGDSDCGLRDLGARVGSTPGMETWRRRCGVEDLGRTTRRGCRDPEWRENGSPSRAWDWPRLIIVLDLGRKLGRGERQGSPSVIRTRSSSQWG